MKLSSLWQKVKKRLLRQHRAVKSFEHESQVHGGVVGIADVGTRVVPTAKVVGSVSRWRNLRSDFFYRTGTAMIERFVRVGQAMQAGKALPPLELFKLKRRRPDGSELPEPSEYYVVDGHHRVAMARKLGQDFLDAHVVEYRVRAPDMPEQSSTLDAPPTDGKRPASGPPADPGA